MAASSLHVIDIERVLRDEPPRKNFNVFRIDNGAAIRIAKVRGTFPRHVHRHHDEGWFVVRGAIRIETGLGSTDVRAGQATRIPAGMTHRTVAVDPDSLVMIVNSVGFATEYLDGDSDQTVDFVEGDLGSPSAGESGR